MIIAPSSFLLLSDPNRQLIHSSSFSESSATGYLQDTRAIKPWVKISFTLSQNKSFLLVSYFVSGICYDTGELTNARLPHRFFIIIIFIPPLLSLNFRVLNHYAVWSETQFNCLC